MAAPAPRPVHTAGRRCERETSGMAISNRRSTSGTKNTGCGSNDGTTLFEEQNGRSTRARDHAYLARNWKFESIPLQRRVNELSVPLKTTPVARSHDLFAIEAARARIPATRF